MVYPHAVGLTHTHTTHRTAVWVTPHWLRAQFAYAHTRLLRSHTVALPARFPDAHTHTVTHRLDSRLLVWLITRTLDCAHCAHSCLFYAHVGYWVSGCHGYITVDCCPVAAHSRTRYAFGYAAFTPCTLVPTGYVTNALRTHCRTTPTPLVTVYRLHTCGYSWVVLWLRALPDYGWLRFTHVYAHAHITFGTTRLLVGLPQFTRYPVTHALVDFTRSLPWITTPHGTFTRFGYTHCRARLDWILIYGWLLLRYARLYVTRARVYSTHIRAHTHTVYRTPRSPVPFTWFGLPYRDTTLRARTLLVYTCTRWLVKLIRGYRCYGCAVDFAV